MFRGENDMKRVILLMICVLLVGCGNKGITLGEYANIDEVVVFEEFFFRTEPSIKSDNIVEFTNELIAYTKEYKEVYNGLKDIDISTLGKEAKELHILYMNIAYNEIRYKELLAKSNIDVYVHKDISMIDKDLEDVDKYRLASEEYMEKLNDFHRKLNED